MMQPIRKPVGAALTMLSLLYLFTLMRGTLTLGMETKNVEFREQNEISFCFAILF